MTIGMLKRGDSVLNITAEFIAAVFTSSVGSLLQKENKRIGG